MGDLPTGLWLLASHALHRDVLAGEPYPHVCGRQVGSTGQRLWRRDCAACLAATTEAHDG